MGMSSNGNNSLSFQATIKIKTYKNRVTYPLLKKKLIISRGPIRSYMPEPKASAPKKSIYEVLVKFIEAFDYSKFKLIEFICLLILFVDFSFKNRPKIFDWTIFRQIWRVIFFGDVFDLFDVKI